MSDKPENPPAFPQPLIADDNGICTSREYGEGGMTLLDWFAGKALQGIIVAEGVNVYDVPADQGPLCAKWAYEYAEAMLAERARRIK